MASKSFKVTGARKDDGKDVDVTLQAVSPDDATEQANRLGIMVGTVTSVDESVQQGRRRQEQEACNQANGMGILVAEVNGATAHRVLAEEWLARPYRAIAIAAFVLGIIFFFVPWMNLVVMQLSPLSVCFHYPDAVVHPVTMYHRLTDFPSSNASVSTVIALLLMVLAPLGYLVGCVICGVGLKRTLRGAGAWRLFDAGLVVMGISSLCVLVGYQASVGMFRPMMDMLLQGAAGSGVMAAGAVHGSSGFGLSIGFYAILVVLVGGVVAACVDRCWNVTSPA